MIVDRSSVVLVYYTTNMFYIQTNTGGGEACKIAAVSIQLIPSRCNERKKCKINVINLIIA